MKYCHRLLIERYRFSKGLMVSNFVHTEAQPVEGLLSESPEGGAVRKYMFYCLVS